MGDSVQDRIAMVQDESTDRLNEEQVATAASQAAWRRPAGHWLGIGASLVVGTLWFFHVAAFDLHHRLRGDAGEYYSIAAGFADFSDALSFAGGRSVGFPLFTYAMLRLLGPVHTRTDLEAFVQSVSCVMFAVHVIAVLFFFEVMRRSYAARTGRNLHWALAALLLAYPGMVGHTTVLLTDTFSADLLMVGFALFVIGEKSARAWAPLATVGSGLALGYACLCRPTYTPVVLGSLGLVSLVVAAKALRRRCVREWRSWSSPALCALGCAALLVPAAQACAARFGKACLIDPAIVPRVVPLSLQAGADSPRLYWSAFALQPEQDTWCGGCFALRDATLTRTWAQHCHIDPARLGFGLPGCFVRRPDLGLLFLAKKSIGLFDSYQYQDYAVDLTPSWARLWSRPFGALAFAGVVAAMILFARALIRGVPWLPEFFICTMTLAQTFGQSLGHIEGRYSYGIVPGALLALFALVATLADSRPRFRQLASVTLVLAGLAFLAQTSQWDASDFVLHRIEASIR